VSRQVERRDRTDWWENVARSRACGIARDILALEVDKLYYDGVNWRKDQRLWVCQGKFV